MRRYSPGLVVENPPRRYAQNCHPAGPVSQMLAETVRRILAAAALYGRESPEQQRNQSSLRYSCSWQDQTVLAETMLAVSENRSFTKWECLFNPVDKEAWREIYGSLDGVPEPFGNPKRQFSPWRLQWRDIPGMPPVTDPPREGEARFPACAPCTIIRDCETPSRRSLLRTRTLNPLRSFDG